MYRLKDGVIPANVCAWHQAWTANQTSANVGRDRTVQVGHDHDIELLRFAHQLQYVSLVRKSREKEQKKKPTCIAVLSTIMSLKLIPLAEYVSATLLHVFKKRPSPNFLVTLASVSWQGQCQTSIMYMILALCTQVTFLRPFLSAKSKANWAMRSVFALVTTLRDSMTPGKDCRLSALGHHVEKRGKRTECSRPEYSPSVFSRMMTKSTLL